MTAKNLLTLVLLLFVVTAVVMTIRREARTDSPTGSDNAVGVDAQLPADGIVTNGVIAYYFHSNTRCPTCRKIEAYAQEAIEVGFAAELAAGDIAWQLMNYELPANAHFAIEYEIAAPTVVLVRVADGQQTDWQNLARVWELIGDQDAFAEYVREGVAQLLKQNSNEAESLK